MAEIVYKILRIDEDDYGCEARPDNYIPVVRVSIEPLEKNEYGETDTQVIMMEDSIMYQRNLNEGDECVLGIDGQIYPVGMMPDMDEDSFDETVNKQNKWMDNYLDAVEEMEND